MRFQKNPVDVEKIFGDSTILHSSIGDLASMQNHTHPAVVQCYPVLLRDRTIFAPLPRAEQREALLLGGTILAPFCASHGRIDR